MTHNHLMAVVSHVLSPFSFFSVDTDVDADVNAAGCQGALMGSRGETKHHLPMEEKWKQEDPDTRE